MNGSRGGAKRPGFDAYATSKQAILASAMAFARLHINAIEPGFNPATSLGGGDAGAFVRFVQKFVVPLLVTLLMAFMKILSTPTRSARVITGILTDASGRSGGVYYNERRNPMQGSELVRDPKFQDRVGSETRALLSTIPRGA